MQVRRGCREAEGGGLLNHTCPIRTVKSVAKAGESNGRERHAICLPIWQQLQTVARDNDVR